MNKAEKISSYQLFLLMAVSRALSTLTFIPQTNENVGLIDYIAASVAAWLFMPVVFMPVILLIKSNRTDSIFTLFPKAGKPLSIAVCILLLFMAVFTLSRLNLFISTVFFPEKDTTVLMIITLLAVCYCASLSLEPVARAGTFIFAVLALSLAVITVSLVDKLELNNITPVMSGGISSVIKLALSVTVRTVEPLFLILLLPVTNGNVKKGFIIWIAATGLALSVITALLTLSLGESALYQLFPYHAMAQLADLGVLERMDALLTGVWIFSAFLRLCLILYLINNICQKTFKTANKVPFTAISGVIILTAVLVSEKSLSYSGFIFSLPLRACLFAIFVILLPTAAVIKIKLKEKRVK